jgi:hypothetical protein
MRLVETFTNGAAVIEIDGHQFVFTAYQRKGEIWVQPWAPAFDGSPWENPAWGALDAMRADGRVRQVFEGLSIAHNDHDVWVGEPLPVEFGTKTAPAN